MEPRIEIESGTRIGMYFDRFDRGREFGITLDTASSADIKRTEQVPTTTTPRRAEGRRNSVATNLAFVL
ncbi:hypothetical protein EVAR_89679_1 [Eumeta japonica]|uniref:Uncharacterized protein n=1 Tax=Eumeta variegata TaxID=151549 RepID=A0A4C1YB55_EUMVA|nr:hypothetical protein EVAR_89679_1 [Eumeta japonica]